MNEIYTHPAPHHMDEIMAIAILMAVKPETRSYGIVETINGDQDIDDTDYMIDIGMKYDGVQYFDHHQLDENVSAMKLVAEAFAPDLLEDKGFYNFIKYKTLQDTIGPKSAYLDKWKDQDDQDKEDIDRFWSLFYIERAITNMDIRDSVKFILNVVILPLVNNLKLEKELEKEVTVNVVNSTFNSTSKNVVVVVSLSETAKRTNRSLVNSIVSKQIEGLRDAGLKVLGSIMPSNRIDGDYDLKRIDTSFDLNNLKSVKANFVHKSGFLLSFTPTPRKEISEEVALEILKELEENL